MRSHHSVQKVTPFGGNRSIQEPRHSAIIFRILPLRPVCVPSRGARNAARPPSDDPNGVASYRPGLPARAGKSGRYATTPSAQRSSATLRRPHPPSKPAPTPATHPRRTGTAAGKRSPRRLLHASVKANPTHTAHRTPVYASQTGLAIRPPRSASGPTEQAYSPDGVAARGRRGGR